MRSSGDPAQEANWLGKGVARTLRAVLFAVIVNPFAIVAAGILAWLLVHAVTGTFHYHVDSAGWEFREVLSCGICITALTFLTFLAIGHVVLTIIAGWAGNQ
jgi:hypothetical protein